MSIAKSTGAIPKKYENNPKLFFKFLKGAEYIKNIRAPGRGKLDIVATSEKLGLPLRHDLTELRGDLTVVDGLIEGIGPEKGLRPIAIRIKPTAKNPDFTFAHEVGHYFLDIKGFPNFRPDQAVEDFCDYFANKLLSE